MGGKHCCIVGWHYSNPKTRFEFDKNRRCVSYFSLPGDKVWRSKPIAAVNLQLQHTYVLSILRIDLCYFMTSLVLQDGEPSLCLNYGYISFLLTDFYVPMLVLICMHEFLCGCWYMYWTWLVTKSSISCTLSFTAFLNFITFASTPHHEQSREC